MPNAQILVATDGNVVQVRVIGQATFACSQGLRDFGMHMIDKGVAQVAINLSECLSMDSTFMGVLALLGLNGMNKKVGVCIVNASEANVKLLASLGVKRLFEFSRTEDDATAWVNLQEAVPEESATRPLGREQTILEAHETLMEIDPENVPKFKDVVEFLREDIKNLQT